MVSWHENTGDPLALSFAHEVPIVTKVPQHGVDVVDVDGDGDKDLLVTQTESGGVTGWHENLSGGIFADVQVITDDFLYGSSWFHPADLDGDADLDLLMVFRSELVFEGAGRGRRTRLVRECRAMGVLENHD